MTLCIGSGSSPSWIWNENGCRKKSYQEASGKDFCKRKASEEESYVKTLDPQRCGSNHAWPAGRPAAWSSIRRVNQTAHRREHRTPPNRQGLGAPTIGCEQRGQAQGEVP